MLQEAAKSQQEETKEVKPGHVTFEGVDEDMELDEADNQELLKFETVQTAAKSAEIEFDKIKISDVRPYHS